jgi:phosphate transport system permease protein
MPTKITTHKTRPGEIAVYGFIYLLSTIVVGLVVFFVGYILFRGLPALSWDFLTTAENPIEETIGIFPSIVNTLYAVFFSLLLAVPLGVGAAIYLNEYAKSGRIVDLIEFATETLAGIPSILYGIFGYVFFCVLLNLHVSILAGILTLTIMVLPIMIRTTQEALRAIPQSYRDGALALSATKWHLIHTILLPSSIKGILSGVILSIGRMVSESAALLLVAGGSAMYMPRGSLWDQLSHSGSTLSVELYRYAMSRGDNQSAFAIAAVLLIIVVTLNLLTRFTAWRLNKS